MSLSPRIERRAAVPAPDLPPGLHAVTRRVLAGRGLHTPADLDCALGGLLPPHALGGLEHAAALVADSLTRDQRILVIGDFDADGATSTALAVRALRAMGARDVDYLVPNRLNTVMA